MINSTKERRVINARSLRARIATDVYRATKDIFLTQHDPGFTLVKKEKNREKVFVPPTLVEFDTL